MIFMSVLTLTLKSPVSRWVNRIIGILYAMIILAFWVLGFALQSAGYEIGLVNSTTCVCLTGCLVRLEMD